MPQLPEEKVPDDHETKVVTVYVEPFTTWVVEVVPRLALTNLEKLDAPNARSSSSTDVAIDAAMARDRLLADTPKVFSSS